MTETRDFIFTFLIIFWTILIIISNLVDEELTKNGEYYLSGEVKQESQSFINKVLGGIFDTLDKIPVINFLTPILKIMSFQYNQDLVPWWLSWVLNIFTIFTVYIVYSLTRKG